MLRRKRSKIQVAVRALPACAATALLIAGCGSESPKTSAENVVRNLYSSLDHEDYAAACDDYSPNNRAALAQALHRIEVLRPSIKASVSCPNGLAYIHKNYPSALKSPIHVESTTIKNGVASVTFSGRTAAKITGYSTASLSRYGGAWKIDRLAAASISKNK